MCEKCEQIATKTETIGGRKVKVRVFRSALENKWETGEIAVGMAGHTVFNPGPMKQRSFGHATQHARDQGPEVHRIRTKKKGRRRSQRRSI